MNERPPQFDRAFLHWFRDQTEATWRTYATKTAESYVAARTGGADWQRGTRWLGGLEEQEIVCIEQRYQVRFPPDYRLFLQVLHSADRPMVGAGFIEGNRMVPHSTPSFYNWQSDTTFLQWAIEWLVEGLFFDVQKNDLWLPSWGAKPSTEAQQEARVRELITAAPKLIPVFGHRYLLAEPCQAGNPIFSIHQSDMIIYGKDLYSYFLAEFGDLLRGVKPLTADREPTELESYEAIPFWGEILCGDF